MSDLISRNDVVEAIEFEKVYMTAYKGSSSGYVSEGNPFKQYNKGLDDAIKAVNSLAPAEPKWIPVTEALPEEGQEVLCTVIGYPATERVTITDCRYKDGVWQQCIEADYDYWTELTGVVAWMPLPKPWEGE